MTAQPPPEIAVPLVPLEGVDDVGLVREHLGVGTPVRVDGGVVAAIDDIPAGHKVAVRAIAEGTPVRKYGEAIGIALRDIAPGSHVHSHNLGVGPQSLGLATVLAEPPVWTPPAAPTRDHFLGYRRPDGRAATRNYLAVLPTVNCSSTVARMIAQAANAQIKAEGLDGVIALTHDLGCGMAEGTAGDDILRRTLRGYAGHANLAGAVMISLGCEINQPEHILGDGPAVETLSIQDLGGTAATVNAALNALQAMASRLAGLRREPIPVGELILGLQCGGSDAYSGLTANPTLGVAADLLVAAGGKVILGETPEIYGAEHMLRARAATPAVGRQIDDLIAWWQAYTASNNAELDNNPSKGNRDGGITTIWEKSLGAVLKGGTSPLNAVVAYADPVTATGLTFMDTPGYDPVSATGMVAGGANLLAFTTGRGSVFGARPTPCLKISTTTRLFEHMRADMDFDAGPAMSRDDQIRHGIMLFEALMDMASGTPSKSEALGFGTEEIVPWRMGAVV
ncbi:altronate hydrolase [Streptosporangium subroseum]|uniref:Altronate hydrolase n=1 Tax=Streptosporangium subroseum TaxID=106412 RepID=A0A239J4E6_9ACTN|nr:altronate dehydratase family protein [Streptosporangium subroseum]SNT00552.1 altronate hydrolase [Streptosporangium subroseum]